MQETSDKRCTNAPGTCPQAPPPLFASLQVLSSARAGRAVVHVVDGVLLPSVPPPESFPGLGERVCCWVRGFSSLSPATFLSRPWASCGTAQVIHVHFPVSMPRAQQGRTPSERSSLHHPAFPMLCAGDVLGSALAKALPSSSLLAGPWPRLREPAITLFAPTLQVRPHGLSL